MKLFDKKNRVELIIASAGVLVMVAAIILLIVFLTGNKKTPNWSFSSYKDNLDEKKSDFVSKSLNFDGALDDEAWHDQRWLEVAQSSNDTVKVKMTSFFGEDGLYLGFDVRDMGVYFSDKRLAALNSGIQLYFSSTEGADNIEGHGYEIMLTAGGTVQIRKFLNGSYINSAGNIRLATKTDGDINSAECKGYTMETFIPYEMLGDNHGEIFASPAIVRSMSEQGEERQWYWFGEELISSQWTVASTWWKFDKNGLIANSVTFEAGTGGKLEGNTYVTDDSDYSFKILPDSGYYASDVLVGDTKVENHLNYKNGQAYYIVENVKGNLNIKAKFQKLPSETTKVSGKVWDGKASVKGAVAWAVKNGFAQPLTIGADGSYTADVPVIEGIQIYAEASDYISNFVPIKTGGNHTDLVLRKNYLGINTNSAHPGILMTQWDLSRLYENRARMKFNTSTGTLMNDSIFSNNAYASANVTIPDRKGIDSRAGFIFTDKSGNSVFVAVTMNAEVGEYNPLGEIIYNVQIIGGKGGELSWSSTGTLAGFTNPEAVRAAANSKEGVSIAAHYHGGVVDVWVAGEKVGQGIVSMDKNGAPTIAAGEKVAVGMHSWNNRTVYSKLTFEENRKVDTTLSVPGWDISQLSKGTAKCLVEDFMVTAPLTTNYANKLSVSANIKLPAQDGKDTRAGFGFMNKNETQVFIMFSMNGQVSDYNPEGKAGYNIQIITQLKNDANLSWNHGGVLTNIMGWVDVRDLANSEAGVPLTVYVENGRFTIGINGILVADGVFSLGEDGKNTLADDTAVKANLVSAMNKTTFTKIKTGVDRPKLSVRAADEWDTKQLDKGKVSLTKPIESSAILWPEFMSKRYISANIPMKPAGQDIRAGFRFVDKDNNIMFVSLLNDSSNRYMVQVITISVGGTWHWSSGYHDINKSADVRAAAKSDEGLPFAVAFNNGKIDIWVNNVKIASDVVPKANETDNLFKNNAQVAVGLECWSFAGKFNNIVVADSRP